MNVIGHQTISVKKKWELGFPLCEQDQHLEIVVIRAKDKLTIITTGDDVVEAAFDLEPGLTDRGGIFSPLGTNCNLQA